MSELVKVIKNAISEKLGNEPVLFNTELIHPFFDAIIICDATNSVQANAIAVHIANECKKHNFLVRSIQGNQTTPWVLVDLDSVIVHVFVKEERIRMSIESLYADLERVNLNDDI